VLEELVIAAQLHDIGAAQVIAQRILSAAPALHRVGAIVRAAHERWDGKGYIDGLAGDAIPLAARIIAVCDTFAAMTSARPYWEPVSVDEALAELRRCAVPSSIPKSWEIVRSEGNGLVADAA
jgi:HD-GYP domain-containing protein (c-di-GMP phosphodiesterase class II)